MSFYDSWSLVVVFIGGIATLAIFSFLIKENPFYRFFEHLYIGIAAGFGILLPIKNFIWPKILEPMLGFNNRVFPDGTYLLTYEPLYLLYLLPGAFGLLFYFVYSKKNSWLAKLVIGFLLGASGGMAFQGFFNYVLPQLDASAKPFLVFTEGEWNVLQSFNNALFVFSLLSVMYYFFFSFRSDSRPAKGFASSGRWIMMICFGAYFGSTVMARMALLVERLEFLIHDWSSAVVAMWRVVGPIG